METFNSDDALRIDRRTALKWVIAAGAVLKVHLPALAAEARKGASMVSGGYGKDPDLIRNYQGSPLWPLTLSQSQRVTATALCDVIIPEDAESPAASKVGVVDFIDEWISAPYPDTQRDKPVVIDGLAWIDAEAQRRFKNGFAAATETQRVAICSDLAGTAAKPELAQPAAFFKRYRALTAGGFYTTPAGMKDLRYVGNVALTKFDGPPPEVLKKLGLA